MDLQTSFQIMGWVIIGVCVFFLLAVIITSNIKLLITHYYSIKKAYAQALLEMEAPGSLVEMVEAIAKKHNDKLVGKDS